MFIVICDFGFSTSSKKLRGNNFEYPIVELSICESDDGVGLEELRRNLNFKVRSFLPSSPQNIRRERDIFVGKEVQRDCSKIGNHFHKEEKEKKNERIRENYTHKRQI